MEAIRGSKTLHRPAGAQYICFTRLAIRDDGSFVREILSELRLSDDVVAVRLVTRQPKKQPRIDAGEHHSNVL